MADERDEAAALEAQTDEATGDLEADEQADAVRGGLRSDPEEGGE